MEPPFSVKVPSTALTVDWERSRAVVCGLGVSGAVSVSWECSRAVNCGLGKL